METEREQIQRQTYKDRERHTLTDRDYQLDYRVREREREGWRQKMIEDGERR